MGGGGWEEISRPVDFRFSGNQLWRYARTAAGSTGSDCLSLPFLRARHHDNITFIRPANRLLLFPPRVCPWITVPSASSRTRPPAVVPQEEKSVLEAEKRTPYVILLFRFTSRCRRFQYPSAVVRVITRAWSRHPFPPPFVHPRPFLRDRVIPKIGYSISMQVSKCIHVSEKPPKTLSTVAWWKGYLNGERVCIKIHMLIVE